MDAEGVAARGAPVPCATTGRKAGAPQRGPITNPSSAPPAAPARAPPPVPRPQPRGSEAEPRAGSRGRAGPGRDAAGARVQEAGGAGAPRPEPAPRGHLPRRCGDRAAAAPPGDSAASDPVPGLRSRRRSSAPAPPPAPASAPGPAHAPRAARSLGSAAPGPPCAPWPRPAPGPPRGRPAPRRPASRPLPYKAGRRGPRGHTARRGGAAPVLPPPAGPRAPGDGEGRVIASRLGRSGASLSAETLWVRAGAGAVGLGPHGAGAEGGEWERPASAAGRRERAVSAPARSGRAPGRRACWAALAGGWGRGATLPAGGDRSSCLPGPWLPVSKRRPQRLFHCSRPSRDTCCPPPPGGELAGTPAALTAVLSRGSGAGVMEVPVLECSDPVCRGLPVGPPGPCPVEKSPGCRDAQPPGEEWLSSRFQLSLPCDWPRSHPRPFLPSRLPSHPLPRLHTHFTHTPCPPGPVLCPDCKALHPNLT